MAGGQQAEPFGPRAGNPFKLATAKMIALQFVASPILTQPAFLAFVIMIDSTNLIPEGIRVVVDQQVAEFVQDEIRENRRGQHDCLPMQVESPGFRARSPAEPSFDIQQPSHSFGMATIVEPSETRRPFQAAKRRQSVRRQSP